MNTYHTLAIMINDLCSMMTSSIEIPPSSTSDAAIPDKSIQNGLPYRAVDAWIVTAHAPLEYQNK